MGLTLDESIKFANTAASLSLGVVGEVPSIPDLQVVMDNCGMAERIIELKNKMAEEIYQKTQAQAPVKPKLGQAFTQNDATQQSVESAPAETTAQTNIPAPNVEVAVTPQDTNSNV